MKKINNKKYISLNELTRTLSITRQDLLKLEDDELFFSDIKDDDTKYRYYSLEQIEILKLILKLKEIGLSNVEIKSILNQEKDPTLLEKVTLKEQYIKEVKQLLTPKVTRNILLKSQEITTYYYYEDRNIYDLSTLNSLVEEIYSHIVEKQLLLDSKSTCFILLSKSTLSQLDQANNLSFPLKVRICFPLIRMYDEKNISTLTLSKYLEYTSSNSTFVKELVNIKDLKENKDYKFKNELIYLYNPSSKINNFIINLF